MTNDAVAWPSIDHPTTCRTERIQDDGAVELSLPGGVLRDVRNPEQVRPFAVELSSNEISGRRDVGKPTVLGSPRDPLQARSVHQHLDRSQADRDSSAKRQLCVHSPGAIGGAGIGVNSPDLLREPHMAKGPRRSRSTQPFVVSRDGDAQHAAADVDG